MTKRELIEAMAEWSDDTPVYVIEEDGLVQMEINLVDEGLQEDLDVRGLSVGLYVCKDT